MKIITVYIIVDNYNCVAVQAIEWPDDKLLIVDSEYVEVYYTFNRSDKCIFPIIGGKGKHWFHTKQEAIDHIFESLKNSLEYHNSKIRDIEIKIQELGGEIDGV